MTRAVALVGVGGIAQSHIQAWQQQPDAEIRVLCDVNSAIAEERKTRYELSRAEIVTDFQKVLENDCELVDLCTPSVLHAEQAIAALSAGKHVLCEKPMADTLAQAEAIAATAAAHPDRVYMCEHRQLFDPLVVAVRQQVERIGQPFWFRQRSAHALPVSPGICRTGAFLDMCYHPLYSALHFLGPATTVFAQSKCLVRSEMVNDNGLYLLNHPTGTSVLEGSFSSIGPMGGSRPFELYGNEGTLIGQWAPRPDLKLYLGEQGGPVPAAEPIAIPAGAWYTNAIRHFLDVIDQTVTPLADATAALATMRTYAAALKSVDSGRLEAVKS